MKRTEWAKILPVIQAFAEGKPIQGWSNLLQKWLDADPEEDYIFDNPDHWRIKPGQEKNNPTQADVARSLRRVYRQDELGNLIPVVEKEVDANALASALCSGKIPVGQCVYAKGDLVKKHQNEQNIDILFKTIHEMKDQIGELQLQVQKLETGKRDDEPSMDERIRQEAQLATDIQGQKFAHTTKDLLDLLSRWITQHSLTLPPSQRLIEDTKKVLG